MTGPGPPLRDLFFGISVAGGILGLAFFGTFGSVEAATLALTIVVFIWAATTDPRHLTDDSGRPALMLFALAGVGVALIFTVAVLISTVTEYLALAIATTAVVVGFARAVRFGMTFPRGEG